MKKIFRSLMYAMLIAYIANNSQAADLTSQDYFILGEHYKERREYDKALTYYQEILRIDPRFFYAAFNSGLLFQIKKEYTQAIKYYQIATEIDKNCAQAHYNCGICHTELKDYSHAQICLEQAISCKPEYEKAFIQLAIVHRQQNNIDKAYAIFRKILSDAPQNITALRECAKTLSQADRLDEAAIYFERALQIEPDHMHTQFDLANIYNMLNKMDEALFLYKELVSNHPQMSELIYNYAYALKKVGRVEESISYYKKALQLKPNYANAHFSLGLGYLTLGDFKHGWQEYEWRWASYGESSKKFDKPIWNGSDLHGKRIFVYAEQGLGDTFQFIRYLKLLKSDGAYIIFQTQNALKPLLSLCHYIDELVIQGQQNLPYFDTHIALMSLPLVFDTRLETVPSEIPYICADEKLVDYWKEQLSADTHLKVGICWQGNAHYRTQALRHTVAAKSVSAALFAPLADVKNVSFYNLQKINGEDQLANLPEGFILHSFGPDFDESHGRFMDTAALIKNLDLVITIDTSICHCSAALGANVWLLLPTPADWRWMLERTDTPWYPNMRLFRQKKPGDWHSLMLEVRDALQEYVVQHRML